MFRVVSLVFLCVSLAACGDPLAGLDRLTDVDVAEGAPSTSALPTEAEVARDGYFGTDAAAPGAAAQAAVEEASEAPPRGGLLGLFRRAAPVQDADPIAAAVAQSEQEVENAAPAAAIGQKQVAARTDAPVPPVAEITTPARPGFLAALLPLGANGNGSAPRIGPDAREVDYDTRLPFGEVARVCAARGKPLGRKIEKANVRGYTLFDSDPGSAAARTFYITGFGDGCPRQLTAANVLLGSASLYEQFHYGPGSENLPQGDTDRAYEKVKRKVCGVAARKPCGRAIAKMDKSTFFISAYASFSNSNTWKEILVHDGQMLASAVKSNN